jgi:hypothetical protein
VSASRRRTESIVFGFTKDDAIGRKRWTLKRVRGKITVVIVREVYGSSISCNGGQEPIEKERARTHRKGNIMPKNVASKTIEQLLAEADELIQQINSDVINDIEEEHRLQFEKHAQSLKKIKSEVQDKIEKKEISEISSGAEGMHEAIQDIVKAMQDLKNYLF